MNASGSDAQMLCFQILQHTSCYCLPLSRASCATESPKIPILWSQVEDVPVCREDSQTATFVRDNRNACDPDWERLSLVTDPQAQPADSESKDQICRDPGLDLHRERA